MWKSILDAIIIFMLVALAFSPAIVLRFVDKHVFKKKDVSVFYRDVLEEPLELNVHDGENGFNEQAAMERDHQIYSNLKRMVKMNRKKRVRGLWKRKVAEFERTMRWKALENRGKGTNTLPVL